MTLDILAPGRLTDEGEGGGQGVLENEYLEIK